MVFAVMLSPFDEYMRYDGTSFDISTDKALVLILDETLVLNINDSVSFKIN